MPRLSVCIATLDRPESLRVALDGLVAQTRPADDVVISDASTGEATRTLVESYARKHPDRGIRLVRSAKRALPWQRWWAFSHSEGEITLFLDDDVTLVPTALGELLDAYERLKREQGQAPAGVGMAMHWPDGTPELRIPSRIKDRWIGIAGREEGTLTPGGLPVAFTRAPGIDLTPIAFLWGGAMSYRSDVLRRIGPLDHLVELYQRGYGRGEDLVLSHLAARYGPLYQITRPLALHPRPAESTRSAYATAGYRLGVTETWGRAHLLGWLATDRASYRRAWRRVVSLELARTTTALVRRPWASAAWARLAGDLAGLTRSLVHRHAIPEQPYAEPRRAPVAAEANPSGPSVPLANTLKAETR